MTLPLGRKNTSAERGYPKLRVEFPSPRDGRRCVTPYSNFWTDRFASSFLPLVLHTIGPTLFELRIADNVYIWIETNPADQKNCSTARATFKFFGNALVSVSRVFEYIWNFGGSFSCQHFLREWQRGLKAWW